MTAQTPLETVELIEAACQEKTLRGGGRMGHPFLLLQDMECGLGQCKAQAAGRLSLIGA